MLSDVDEDSWTEVGRYARAGDAEAAALVLASAGIGSRLVRQPGDIALLVTSENALRAGYELVEYNRENRRRPPPNFPALWRGADAAFAYATVLIVLFVAQTREMFGLDWAAAGAAQAGLILSGEWWRTLTALTLHAGLDHLASNVFAGVVLGLFVTQVLGPGLAWLSILIAAGLGNFLNALVVSPEHTSIGASTGVFAALGLLAALMWRQGAGGWTRGLRAWLPLAAGVMLLALLGFGGERVDFGAHIAGFLTGIVAGAGLHFAYPHLPRGRRAQYVYGALALAIMAAAWIVALTAT